MNKKVIITIVLATIIGLSSVGATWYFMDKSAKDQKIELENKAREAERQLNELKDQTEKSKDETSDWKTYDGKYSLIKYPGGWVYKDDYSVGQDFSMVAFGDSISVLPKPQSDQISAISVSDGKGESMSQYYKSSNTVNISNVTIGKNIKAVKIVLSPGRAEDMYGDSKITYYDIKAKNGSYITISNFEDYEIDTFNKMLTTFELK